MNAATLNFYNYKKHDVCGLLVIQYKIWDYWSDFSDSEDDGFRTKKCHYVCSHSNARLTEGTKWPFLTQVSFPTMPM